MRLARIATVALLGIVLVTSIACSSSTSNPTPLTQCIDSDGGKNYYVAGNGSGYNAGMVNYFYDTCYQSYWANLVDSCSGSDCYLAEKYCDGLNISTEIGIICPNGCSNGACIP